MSAPTEESTPISPNSARPKVSVVMAVYKGADVLEKTVRTVLDQTFRELEFVVVADGPDPEVESVLASIDDPRLVIIVLPQNGGVPEALNAGLAACRGDYFARMDNGDFCDPKRIQLQMEAVQRTGSSVSFCQSAIVDDNGATLETSTNQPWILRLWMSQFCQSLGTSGPALFVSTELLRSLGGMDETYRYAQDYEICERLAALGREFAYTEEVGVICPTYEGGISRQKRQAQEEFTRTIMARATRRTLPEVTEEQLKSLACWRKRYPLEGENDPMPAILLLPRLAKSFARRHGLAKLPFDICNDIAGFTELHFQELQRADARAAFRLILWCAWQCKSLRLHKFALGAVKRKRRGTKAKVKSQKCRQAPSP